MFRTVSVVAALSVGLWVASARAQGTPWGGDDTGLIPPAKSSTAKCEAGAAVAITAPPVVASAPPCPAPAGEAPRVSDANVRR